MPKKTDAFLFPPGLPVRRMAGLLLPVILLLSLMTTCQEPENHSNDPDTTSHYFNWTIDTIGIPGTLLHDVAVINENDIWVVGEIHTDEPDTIHHNPFTNYNAAHWDGARWKLYRLLFYDFCSAPDVGSYPYSTRAVYAFNDSQVVVSGDIQLTLLNGDEQQQILCSPVSINAIWGPSIDNFWVIGRYGKIAHYDGNAFTIQTTVGGGIQLLDIWGLDENHIWAAGSVNNLPDLGSSLLRYQNGFWETKYHVDSPFDSLGFISHGSAIGDTLYLSTGVGVWKESLSNRDGGLVPRRALNVGEWALGRIRGPAYNDLILQTAASKYIHWNGANWKPVMVFDNYAPGQVYWMGNFVLKRDFALLTGGANGGGIVFRSYR